MSDIIDTCLKVLFTAVVLGAMLNYFGVDFVKTWRHVMPTIAQHMGN